MTGSASSEIPGWGRKKRREPSTSRHKQRNLRCIASPVPDTTNQAKIACGLFAVAVFDQFAKQSFSLDQSIFTGQRGLRLWEQM